MLPPDAAGFHRGTTMPAAPGDGRAVAYATDGLQAAGALVELTVPSEPGALEGADSPAAQAALDRMLAEVTHPGVSRTMHEQARFLLPARGEPPVLRCVETAGRYGREQVEGLLCAGILRGALLRLRVTMPRLDPPAADPHAFARAILAVLRSSPS